MNQQETEDLKKAYDRMQKRVYRLVKSGDLVEGTDYYEISPSDNLSDGENGQFTDKYYIKIHSIPKLLYNSRNAKELFFWFMDKYANVIDTKRSIGETYILNKKKGLIPQKLGDYSKSFVDCKGWHYDSKAEMLVATVLHKLGLKFDKQVKIHMRKEVLESLLQECPTWDPKFTYITADFLLLSEPKTVIEYWGGKGNKSYDWRMKWKKWIYQHEEIRCIDIIPPEEQNELALMDRLEKELMNNSKR